MKKIIFTFLSIIISLILVAVIAEIGFRIDDLFDKNRGLKNSMGNINRKYCHGFRPNTRFRLIASKNNEYNIFVRINNYGFRGKDITKEKNPRITRIMVLGDSFTFGVGSEEDETIPYLIEKYLNEQGAKGHQVEVINSGFGHYSPLLHYLKTKDEYLEFNPDIVLYFFDFSDLADDWRFEKNLVYDNSGNILRCDPAFINGRRDWWKTMRIYSKLCTYIHNKIIRLIDKIRILGFKNYVKVKIEGKRAKTLIIAKEKEDRNINPIKYDGYLMIRGRDKLPYILKHFKRTEKYLNKIKSLLAEKNIPMILVVYPYGIHVGPSQWGEGRRYWDFEDDKVYDDYYAFDLLEDYAQRNNIPCINVLPGFLKNNNKHLFFDIDGHFTPEANHIVARAVAESDVLNAGIQACKRIQTYGRPAAGD